MLYDTIAAIASAVANQAIAIIKISGKDSLNIINKCWSGKDLNSVASHTIHYGRIYDQKEIIDEVLISVFLAPKSFTGENVVEINCHGGLYVTTRILEIVLANGARLAKPGEFSRRAFLNGRIDLTKAEAIMDIIEAKNKNSLKMANFGLLEKTKEMISAFQKEILELILKIEVNIDYPEYEDEEQITNIYLKPSINKLLKAIEDILEKAEISMILKEGIATAIIGKPNVGKSSLLNALLGENKAIVTNIAGTTRDLVEGSVNIGGVILNLIDTAGIRKTKNFVESIGVTKAKEVLEKAKLILLVLDNSQKLSKTDRELLALTKDKNRIILINKQDLPTQIDLIDLDDYLMVSALVPQDINLITETIKKKLLLDQVSSIDPTYIGNARQIALLQKTKQFLIESLVSINCNMPIDIVNIDLRKAWRTLGEISGQVFDEDIINEMFKRFCLGK